MNKSRCLGVVSERAVVCVHAFRPKSTFHRCGQAQAGLKHTNIIWVFAAAPIDGWPVAETCVGVGVEVRGEI